MDERKDLLTAALTGYQVQRGQIEEKITEIEKRLSAAGGTAPVFQIDQFGAAPPKKKKHRISKEGRARIAEAQRRRWAKAPGRATTAAGGKQKRVA